MARGSSDSSVVAPTGKGAQTNLEPIHTNERVPGHTNYYEKDGLRTYGDAEDHDHEPKVVLLSPRTGVAVLIIGVRCPSRGSCP
jgi:hypothetical protein